MQHVNNRPPSSYTFDIATANYLDGRQQHPVDRRPASAKSSSAVHTASQASLQAPTQQTATRALGYSALKIVSSRILCCFSESGGRISR